MRRLIFAFREAGLRFSRDGCAFLAQAIAFNALFAIFPLFVLGLAVSGFIYGSREGQDKILELTATLAPALHDLIAENIKNVISLRGLAGVIGLAGLVWSGKNLFMALTYALDRALAVPKGRPLLHDIALSIVMLPIMGLLLVVATALPIVVSYVIQAGGFSEQTQASQLIGYGASLLLIFVVTLVLYTFLPNRKLRLGFGVPGASFSAITWPLVQYAFAFYSAKINFTHIYGAVAAILLVLLWFYLMGSIFLFGAQLCAGWAHLKGTVHVAEIADDPLESPALQE